MDEMPEIPEIQVQDAKKALLAGNYLFLDIRDPESFMAEHIDGAIHVHDGNVEELVKTTDKEKPIIIYCFHGNNSVGGAAFFLSKGFKSVYSLEGGFEKWREGNAIDPGNASCS